MLVLIGASASGKTEIAKLLTTAFGYKKIVTNTTREKRVNEINGVDYNFLSYDDFLDKKNRNYFIETVLYGGNYYGTAFKDAIDKSVLIVEPEGANNIIKHNIPNVYIVYLETEESTRKQRMISRGDSLVDITNRINTDKIHFNSKNISHIDYIINTSEKSTVELTKIINDKYQINLEKKEL